MKAVLMSIRPKWCELIASGEKTVEVRKTKPKLETPFKVYIYCTIGDGAKGDRLVPSGIACGKVIGEFVCDKIERGHILWVKEQPEYYDRVEEKTQLTYRKMFDYLGESGIGWFLHISNLVIYDKPKELSEFYRPSSSLDKLLKDRLWLTSEELDLRVKRPPQSWCYVEEQK